MVVVNLQQLTVMLYRLRHCTLSISSTHLGKGFEGMFDVGLNLQQKLPNIFFP